MRRKTHAVEIVTKGIPHGRVQEEMTKIIY